MARSCRRRAAKRISATCTAPTSGLSPSWKQRIADLRAVHNLDFSRTRRHGEQPMTEAQRNEVPPVDHPIARTHPDTGRKCIYLGDHAEYVMGMDYDEGRALIEELNALAVHAGSYLRAPLDAGRFDRLGQPLRDASGNALRSCDSTPRSAPLHGAGGSAAALSRGFYLAAGLEFAVQREVPLALRSLQYLTDRHEIMART